VGAAVRKVGVGVHDRPLDGKELPMRRAAWVCPASILAALLAVGGAVAAETGMLYVKSDPPGATVVIGGVERGETPVLVKGLPAGETEIELCIEGAKPVTVRETVEANKVTTVTADIDVPGSSITVISDPLEATVYLDTKEHGKTPITIDGLPPGKHALLLLKAGFPRSARTIILAAGEERVLEVKLGTAEEDEEAKPAAEPVARPPSRIPEAVEEFLGKFLELTDSGDYAGAQVYAERSAREEAMAEFRADLAAAGEAAELLEGRMASARRGAKALVGKEVELKTKTGKREGRVKAVDDEGITLVREIKVGGRAVGGSTSKVTWADLAPGAVADLAKDWSPEGAKGAVAQALAARAQDDARGVMHALESTGDDLFGLFLKHKAAAAAVAARATEDPAAEWRPLEKRARARRISVNEELRLSAEILAFQQREARSHGIPRGTVTVAGYGAQSGWRGRWAGRCGSTGSMTS
jgi:hypothetical protein